LTHPSQLDNRRCKIFPAIGFILYLILISACNSATPTPSTLPQNPTVPSVSPPASQQALEATQTAAPSATAEANRVVLLALPGGDPAEALMVQGVLNELAVQEGLSFETRSELDRLELEPDLRLVVAMPPDPGLANLASANPGIQFLAVGIAGVEAGPNVSLIGAQGNRPDLSGFLAGYLASVVTQDWRVGVISRADLTEAKAARLGFVNGAIFYCGLCRPAYPPFVQYPLFSELAAEGEQAEQQAADQLIASAVKTVYLAPGIGETFLPGYLTQAGVNLIGSGSPAEAQRPNWIASIRLDQAEAIRQLWPQLINGEGGTSISAPIVITDVNPGLLSLGRQRLVEEMLSELLSGFIDTGVDPQTGEPR